MKKISKKLLAAAVAFIGFSTVASVSGTVAWFTAANTVSVSGMNIQAQAEEGIVIAQEKNTALVAADWKTSVTALHTGAGESFIPTTTKALDVSTGWEHANVDQANDATSGAKYESFTITPATVGTAASVATGTTATQVLTPGKNVYLYNEFYIQAAAKADMLTQNLYIKNITCTESGTAQLLNKALRIGFKIDSEVKVYCPLLGADFTATDHAYSAKQNSQSQDSPNSADYIYTNKTIKAYTDAGTNKIKLEVFCWFDGEDSNCTTSNIEATFNNITLGFSIANVKTNA